MALSPVLEFADVDGDGRAELIHSTGVDLWGYRNQGWTAPAIYSGADNKKLVAGFGTLLGNTFADIDGDGRADLIADTGPSHDYWTYRNQGWAATDMFVGSDSKLTAAGFGPIDGVEFADVDGDTRADLVWANTTNIYAYRNQGYTATAVFTGADQKVVAGGFGALAGNTMADLDGDDRADLVADTGPWHDLWVYRSQGWAAANLIVASDRKWFITTNPMDSGSKIQRVVTITDSAGGSVPDHSALAGQVRETQTLDGAGGQVLSKAIHTQTAWQKAGEALPTWITPAWRYSYMTQTTQSKTYSRLLATSTWRTTTKKTTYDDGVSPPTYGIATAVDDLGDDATAADDICFRTEYVHNTNIWLIGVAKRTWAVGKTCTATPTYPADGISENRYSYDGLAYGATPTKGLPTKSQAAKSYTGSTANLVTTGEIGGHDWWGRPTWMKDGLARQTTTVYTHNAAGLLSSTKVTTPAPTVGGTGHEVITAVDIKRGLTSSVTDPNGEITVGKYDNLGRLTHVYRPGPLRTPNPDSGTPDTEYHYQVQTSAANYVRTRSLGPNGNQIVSFEILDGLLRPRQTQVVAPDGKRTISDTQYEGRGLAAKVSTFHNAASGPTSTLETVTDTAVDRQTRYVYDGAGRQTHAQLWKQNVKQFESKNIYDGDRVGVIPPAGGTVTQDLSDARGSVIEKRQYQSGTALTGPFDRVLYGYDRLGRPPR